VARAKSMSGVVGYPTMDTSTQLPIGISDAIPKRTWEKKKTYGLVDVAGLRTAVITQKDLAVKEKKVASRDPSAPRARRPTPARPRPSVDLTHFRLRKRGRH
jgi:hypothetical protein